MSDSPQSKPATVERLAYSIDETGDVLNLGHSTIYELINSGTLRTVKVRGRRLVPRSAILELLGESTEDVAA